MFPYEMMMLGREVYQERLDAAEMARRIARQPGTNVSLTDRIADHVGDLLINLGQQLKHQRDWQTDARSSRV